MDKIMSAEQLVDNLRRHVLDLSVYRRGFDLPHSQAIDTVRSRDRAIVERVREMLDVILNYSVDVDLANGCIDDVLRELGCEP